MAHIHKWLIARAEFQNPASSRLTVYWACRCGKLKKTAGIA